MKKFSIDFVEGYTLLSDKYVNCESLLEVCCPKGHVYRVTFSKFKNRGDRCLECSDKKKKSVGFVREELKKEGYVLLSNKYKNKDTHLRCRCPKGHITGTLTWNNFRKGRRCFKCFGIARKTISEIRKELSSHGFILLSNEYKNVNTKLLIKCPNSHITNVTWYSFAGNFVCPSCSKTRRKRIEFIKSSFKESGYTLISNSYKNANSKLEYECPKGHKGSITWGHFNNGQRCPVCSEGPVSKISQEWLDSLGVGVREFYIKDLGFRVDGFDPKTSTVYEFLGDYWHGNPERFAKEDINKKNKKSFGQLHEATFRRLRLLEEAGFKVIYIWEKDFISS